MNEMKRIAILLIIIGLGVVGWNGFQFWQQSTVIIKDPELAKSIDKQWEQTTKEPALLFAETEGVETAKKVAQDYEEGQQVGEFVIPKLGTVYPLFWGTSANTLKLGIGMYDTAFTSTPFEKRHTAIAGHRDTTFQGLDQLSEGDRLYVTMDQLKYTYQIRKTWITDAQDQSVLVEKENPTLTLTTCYPFDYIGLAPDRYIVQAELIDQKEIK
ncbi:hypothetical protein ABB05_15570 [Lederbergia galactosidilytica]|uniref:Class D sortase n=2 Tax=Lederbergia galactosidilytica TaxID=217031 RepID=A0A177ZKL7_9BACI|nr:hypothetical protein ABB05_15570 [Lederbergia galactosidilytica]